MNVTNTPIDNVFCQVYSSTEINPPAGPNIMIQQHRPDPALLVKSDYDKAMMFTGDDIGTFLDLIKRAAFMQRDHNAPRGWVNTPSDTLPVVDMEILAFPPSVENAAGRLRDWIHTAEQTLKKHADLIKGAEALANEPSVECNDSASPF